MSTYSFEKSLRPPYAKPSFPLIPEINWHLPEQIGIAMEKTQEIGISGDRKGMLYLNQDMSVGKQDLGKLVYILSGNQAQDAETRSLWIDLEQTIENPLRRDGLTVSSIQMKGVVFDECQELSPYSGAGWPREIYFSDRRGLTQRFDAPTEGAVGHCLLREAVNEYSVCLRTNRLLEGTDIHVPTPIGWGTFEFTRSPTRYGFVLLGLPELLQGRGSAYLSVAERLAVSRDFTEMDLLLRQRARSIRMLNRNGLVSPGRHFGNMSFTPDGHIFVHDLGPPHSVFHNHLHSDEQYVAEAFCQLAYAMTPRKVIVPVPPPTSVARMVAVDYLPQYLHSTLSEYYDNDRRASSITFDEFEATFFDTLETPLQKVKTQAAKLHCECVLRWLNECKQRM